MTDNLSAAQRAYDNRADTRYDDDDSDARADWESDLDIYEVLNHQEINEILWAHLADEPWFQERLDTKWEGYKADQIELAAQDAAASRAEDHYWEAA